MRSLVLFILFQACFSAEERRNSGTSIDWKDNYNDGDITNGPVEWLNHEENVLPPDEHLYETFAEKKRIAGPASRFCSSLTSRMPLQNSCICDSQYGIKDLGVGHYPRYLTVTRCKSTSCSNSRFSCKLTTYMVHVLRLRRLTDVQNDHTTLEGVFSESPLPDSLRQKWQLKPILISVACVPKILAKERA